MAQGRVASRGDGAIMDDSFGVERTNGIRIRIMHGQTVKEGWKHETTVECFFEGGVTAERMEETLEAATQLADSVGREETKRRRSLDATGN